MNTKQQILAALNNGGRHIVHTYLLEQYTKGLVKDEYDLRDGWELVECQGVRYYDGVPECPVEIWVSEARTQVIAFSPPISNVALAKVKALDVTAELARHRNNNLNPEPPKAA